MYKTIEKKDKDKFFYIKETTKGSILADTYMWLTLLGAFWFNYTFIGGNNFIDFTILVFVFLYIVGIARSKIKKFKTKEELINYINNL